VLLFSFYNVPGRSTNGHALKALADIAAKVHMKLMLEPLSKICLMPVNVYVICAEHII
jgi:hypothetical protein